MAEMGSRSEKEPRDVNPDDEDANEIPPQTSTVEEDPEHNGNPSVTKQRTRKSRPMKLEVHVDKRKNKGDNQFIIENVRNKEKRAKLEGYDCHECGNYYDSFNLTDEERQKRVKKCSRHRGTTGRLVRSSTPPGFWDHRMPSTPEAIEQGMMTVAGGVPDFIQGLGGKNDEKRPSTKCKSDESGSNGSPISSRDAKRSS